MGYCSLLSALLITSGSINGQFISPAPAQDGIINSSEYGIHIDGQNQQESGGGTWFLNWDANNLYIAVTGSNPSEGGLIYIDVNPVIPVNGGANNDGSLQWSFDYDRTKIIQPFRGDFKFYFKDSYNEFRYADGSNEWTIETANTITTSANYFTNTIEFVIPWSTVTNGNGRPNAFNWFGYKMYDNGDGNNGTYHPVPDWNPTQPNNAGSGDFNQVFVPYYYSVINTDNNTATKPFLAKSLTYHEDNSGQFVGGMEIGGITLYDLTVNDNSADNDDNAVGYDLYNNAQIANRILISDHVVVNNNLYIGQGSALFPANNLPASSTVDVNLTMDGATGKIYNYGRLDCTPEVTQSSGDWDKRRLNFIFDGTTTIMPSTIFKDRFRFSNITINSSAELLADAGGTAGIEMQYGNLNNNGTLNLSASNSGNISFGLRGENVHANIYTLESSLATGTFIFHDVLIGRWESTLKPKTDGGSMFLQVKGDFENYSIFQAEDGAGLFSLTMNGTSRQEIVGNVNETVNDQTVFRSLSIDNDNGNGDDNAGGDVHFVSYGGGQIDYYVTNVFSLIKGDIVTRDRTDPNISHNLYFDDGCFVAGAGAQSYDGTNTSSFIDGPVSFILLNRPAITLEYFIGKAGSYRKALFTCFNASTTDPIIYTAELFNASAYDLNNTIPSSPELIQNISLVHYWRVETNAPNYFNSGSIWLDYDQNWAHDGVSDPDNLRILKAPTGGNGAWENISVGSGGFGTGSGFIASDTFYSLSDFTLANLGSNPLPVEFLDFSVKRQSDIAQINWSTASEINNEFFKIMRSGNAENFEEIDRVPGQGTTNQISHYERYDLNPLPGWNYYKIIQVDYDGSSEETQMEAVYFDDEAELILYPNPANELIYFSFIAAEIDYFIYDSKGALLVSRSLRSQDGQHVISIQELESGAYFLEVHSQNGQVYRQKFLKF